MARSLAGPVPRIERPLDFWPAIVLTLPVMLLVAQVVVGHIAHPVIYGKIKDEYRGRDPDPVAQDEADEPEGGGLWLPVWVGLIETTAFFLFFVFDVAAVGAFIGTWIFVKMATGWHRFARATESRYYPRMGFGALTLTLLNVLFALVGAQVYLWLRCA